MPASTLTPGDPDGVDIEREIQAGQAQLEAYLAEHFASEQRSRSGTEPYHPSAQTPEVAPENIDQVWNVGRGIVGLGPLGETRQLPTGFISPKAQIPRRIGRGVFRLF